MDKLEKGIKIGEAEKMCIIKRLFSDGIWPNGTVWLYGIY